MLRQALPELLVTMDREGRSFICADDQAAFLPAGQQDFPQANVHGKYSLARFGLGGLECGSASWINQSLLDFKSVGLEINILPSQGQKFFAAHAGIGQQSKQASFPCIF